ncbi:polymorphic transmembrane cluster 2 transmembrane protein 11, partial [Biomphalaria pfeifferi]
MDIDIASSNIDTENTISIRCNNITLFVCRKDIVCIEKTKSNIFNVTKTKDGILRVYFENVARIIPIYINGTWQVCNAGESGNRCDDTLTRQVLIYAQLDYFNCTYHFGDIDHILTISCTMKNIYPQAVCSFDTDNVLSNIRHDYSQDSGNTTRCLVTQDSNKDSFQVKTTMYPNITGDITDMNYGISITLFVMN